MMTDVTACPLDVLCVNVYAVSLTPCPFIAYSYYMLSLRVGDSIRWRVVLQ